MSFQNFKFSFKICENKFQSWAIFAIGSFRANPYRREFKEFPPLSIFFIFFY